MANTVMNISNLKVYALEGLNVLMSGKHGVGKTAIIKEVFTEVFGPQNESWMYFSASTLDPWVDFIGIPKNYTNADGQEVFKIIPPEHFTGTENIQALFFDEINRGEDKTLNALMELIQFKSINGRKFPNLKCVWAAENPADTEDQYSVRALDPAQKDRFQIQLNVPYNLDKSYFVKKYGEELFTLAKTWWETAKLKPSPRKMDDILQGHIRGFNISDFSNIYDLVELKHSLSSIDYLKKMTSVLNTNNATAIGAYFTMDVLRGHDKVIRKNPDVIPKIWPHVNEELQKYMENTFKYKPPVGSRKIFSDAQADYIKQQKTKIGFSTDNYLDLMNRVHQIVKMFSNWRSMTELREGDMTSEDLDSLFGMTFDSKVMCAENQKKLAAIMTPTHRQYFTEFMRISLFFITACNHKEYLETQINPIITRLKRQNDLRIALLINVTAVDKIIENQRSPLRNSRNVAAELSIQKISAISSMRVPA